MLAAFETSAICVVTRAPPVAPRSASSRVCASALPSTSQVATELPAAASCTTNSRPIPDPPPVTTASLPANVSISTAPPGRRLRRRSAYNTLRLGEPLLACTIQDRSRRGPYGRKGHLRTGGSVRAGG